MSQWTADFTNDPNNDYALIIEILCNREDVGVIKPGKHGLELIIFNHDQDIAIPFDWLLGLMNEAKTKLNKI
jgi:hypothetical protein